jgi:hypothetical protein
MNINRKYSHIIKKQWNSIRKNQCIIILDDTRVVQDSHINFLGDMISQVIKKNIVTYLWNRDQ